MVRLFNIWIVNSLYISTRCSPGTEKVVPGEDETITAIGSLLLDHLEEQYRDERKLRDTHPKSNGCLKGTLTVSQDISADYQYGVFQGWEKLSGLDAVFELGRRNHRRRRNGFSRTRCEDV